MLKKYVDIYHELQSMRSIIQKSIIIMILSLLHLSIIIKVTLLIVKIITIEKGRLIEDKRFIVFEIDIWF